MALIICPECGREKVSDTAEACPDCGYGIKAHFERIRQEEERIEHARKLEEEKRKAEIEAKKREEERIKSVPPLTKPLLTAPIITLLISILCFLIDISQVGASEWEVKRSIANHTGDPHFTGVMFILIGVGLVCFGIWMLCKRIEIYNLSKTNLEEYQKLVIKEENAAIASAQAAAAARAREEVSKPECPYCHSRNTTKITATAKAINTAMLGVYGEKRYFQWHCNNCKSDF